MQGGNVDDTVVGPKGVGAGTWINHANDPLIYRYAEDDDREDVALLGSVTTADLIGFANLKKLRINLDAASQSTFRPTHALKVPREILKVQCPT